MEQVVQGTVLCVVGALLALVLKKGSPEMALLVTLAAAGTVLFLLMDDVGELVEFLGELSDLSGLTPDLFVPLYKAVGIALVVRVGGSLCRDAGGSSLAAAVETAGAVCALLAALPLLRAVLRLLLELMG